MSKKAACRVANGQLCGLVIFWVSIRVMRWVSVLIDTFSNCMNSHDIFSLYLDRTGITLMHPLHIGIKAPTLVRTSSTLCDLSSNDWTGSCVGVAENGDIYSFIPQQLLYNVMEKEGNKLRCLLGYTDYIKMDPDHILKDNDSKDLTKDFGIVFCDMNEVSMN